MFRRQASLLLLLSFSSFFFATLGQVGLPGGLSSVQLPLTDERTIKAVNFGVSEISRLSMSDNHLRAYKIIEVKQQVVAGQLYHVKAYLQQTTCKKSEVPVESVTAEKCPFQETRNVGSCTYKVLVQAWKNNLTELKDPDCELYTLTPGE